MQKYRVEIDSEGTIRWYKFGTNKYHRENGPAIEWADGDKYWFLNGKRLTEQEFNRRMNSYNNKIIEIDGKKYQLLEVKE